MPDATSSQRRKAQLLRLRPDLIVVEIRGNVQTRLRQLEEGHADGLLMARAGLMRLGLGQRISEVFGTDKFLPAAGQGIVGLTARTDNPKAKALVQNLVNENTQWWRDVQPRLVNEEAYQSAPHFPSFATRLIEKYPNKKEAVEQWVRDNIHSPKK